MDILPDKAASRGIDTTPRKTNRAGIVTGVLAAGLALVALAFLLGQPMVSAAEASDSCDRLAKEAKWEEAAPFCEQAGDGSALFWLAEMHVRGKGKPQDKAAAVGLYKQAAEKGYGKANLVMGFFHLYGSGGVRAKGFEGLVPRDKAAGEEYVMKAARQNDKKALHWRANYFYNKALDDWDKNALARSFESRRASAEAGATYNMFNMYQVRMWAADKGDCRDANASTPVEFRSLVRKGLARLTDDTIEDVKMPVRNLPDVRCDKTAAMKWLRRAADTAKYPLAMLTLGGEMELQGKYAEAYKWYYLVGQKKILQRAGLLASEDSPYFYPSYRPAALDNYAESAREEMAQLAGKINDDDIASGKKMADEFWRGKESYSVDES